MDGLDKPLCLRIPRRNGGREWDILISSMGVTLRSYICDIDGKISPVSIYRNHSDSDCKEWGTYTPHSEKGCSKIYLDAAKLLEYYGVQALPPEELLDFLESNQRKIVCVGCLDYVNTSILPILEKEIEESLLAS